MTPRYARVVVDLRPAHLDRPFDYEIPEGWSVQVGHMVRVRFAGRLRNGWVVGLGTTTDAARVRPLERQSGATHWFDGADLELYRWVARRWAGTLADVLRHALPKRVAGVERAALGPQPSEQDRPAERSVLVDDQLWEQYDSAGLPAQVAGGAGAYWLRPLPGDETALGVDLVARALAAGRSALVLAPDPASPLLDAVADAAGDCTADLRTSGSERERYQAFLRGRAGTARVVVGERAAVFGPVQDLGLVLVEDEANPAYKERRSPRHNARDVALARAHMAGGVCVLLGDVPSAAVWKLRGQGHVRAVRGFRAAERARAPRVEVVDMADSRTRMSHQASRALREAVDAQRAAVVLAARGGEGSALACRGCRLRLRCPVCDGSLRRARAAGGTESGRQCPACGWQGDDVAHDCGESKTTALAAGAGRLAKELSRSFPQAHVVRMEGFDAPGPVERPAVGVMTRGSVVRSPSWLAGEPAAVLVVFDADAMRGRADLEAGEDALRLWMAAARAAERVVVQTREPTDPVVQALIRWDPDGFWEREYEWRAALGFPPARSLIRVVAPVDDAQAVATELREALPADSGVELLGPDPDGAVLLKTADLRGTLRILLPLREAWGRDDRKVRVDVDPVPAG